MVVKLRLFSRWRHSRFESSVISYGSKANTDNLLQSLSFESSVISYGSKAHFDNLNTDDSLRVV